MALGLLLAVFVVLFIMQGYCVSGDCMQPHLATGERVLAYKMAYAVHGPRRGDIVIFAYPRDPRQTFVKRVVGLPGDTLAIQSGRVYLDGKPLPEPYRVYAAHGDMAADVRPARVVLRDGRQPGRVRRQPLLGRPAPPRHHWPRRRLLLAPPALPGAAVGDPSELASQLTSPSGRGGRTKRAATQGCPYHPLRNREVASLGEPEGFPIVIAFFGAIAAPLRRRSSRPCRGRRRRAGSRRSRGRGRGRASSRAGGAGRGG